MMFLIERAIYSVSLVVGVVMIVTGLGHDSGLVFSIGVFVLTLAALRMQDTFYKS